MSWLCTTERALSARPTEVLEIAGEFVTTDTQSEAAVQALSDLGVRGWAGFSGAMETGFGNLVGAIASSMTSVSVAAGAAEAACATAAATLEALEIESDALLVTAEEQLADLAALQAEAAEWEVKRYWRNQAVIAADSDRAEDPETYETAVRRRHDADAALYWIGTAAETKRGDLAASQAVFERIREDEELAQSDLSTALLPIHDTLNSGELEFSAVDLEGVGTVFRIFDLAYLAIEVDSKGDATARGALIDARNALAALIGADTAENDEYIDAVEQARRDAELRAEYETLSPDQLRDMIADALRRGDTSEADRLARMIELAIEGMNDAERDDFLSNLAVDLGNHGDGWYHLMTLFATSDREMPAWLTTAVLALGGTYHTFFIENPETRRMLAGIVGLDPNDPGLNDAIAKYLIQRAYDSPSWPDIVDAFAAGDVNVGNGDTFGPLLVDYFTKHPAHFEEFVRLANEGTQQPLQELVDTMGSSADDAQFDQVLEAYMAANMPSEGRDSDSVSGEWRHFINELGAVQAALDRVGHGDTYDMAGIIKFAVGTAASTYHPVAGQATSAAFAIIGGYGEDPTYQAMNDFEKLNRDNFVLAITVSLHDPVLGPQIIDAIGENLDDADAIGEFIRTGDDSLYRELSLLAQDIADSRAHNTHG